MSTRQHKVNSLLQRLISEYFVREKPDDLTGLVTIKNVDVTADLEHAKVYFSVVGQDHADVLRILQARRHPIQKMLGQKLQMKMIPRVAFVSDSSGEYADHISQLINQIRNEERNLPSGSPPHEEGKGRS